MAPPVVSPTVARRRTSRSAGRTASGACQRFDPLTLQQLAGNSTVAALFAGGSATPAVQRACCPQCNGVEEEAQREFAPAPHNVLSFVMRSFEGSAGNGA